MVFLQKVTSHQFTFLSSRRKHGLCQYLKNFQSWFASRKNGTYSHVTCIIELGRDLPKSLTDVTDEFSPMEFQSSFSIGFLAVNSSSIVFAGDIKIMSAILLLAP